MTLIRPTALAFFALPAWLAILADRLAQLRAHALPLAYGFWARRIFIRVKARLKPSPTGQPALPATTPPIPKQPRRRGIRAGAARLPY